MTAVSDFNVEIPDGKLIRAAWPLRRKKYGAEPAVRAAAADKRQNLFFGEGGCHRSGGGKRGVGMVFQNYALYPHLTVRQNIIFPLENLKGKEKLSKEEMNKRALEVAKLVQIDADGA